MDHSFGGPWTLIKLDLLGRYLHFFNTALQNKPKPDRRFWRVYIDAFAGTGMCDIKLSDDTRKNVPGSATIALRTEPSFDAFHLIDLKAQHVAELGALKHAHAQKEVYVYRDDANSALMEIIAAGNWRTSRGVIFLDPYGMAVNWATLERIAATMAFDVWYLFPLSGVYRQAAKNFDCVNDDKADNLDRVLGTQEWRVSFYQESPHQNLFDSSIANRTRVVNPKQIASYVQGRLQTVFKGWVSSPILLPQAGAPMFALFFAVSNPNTRAVELSKKVAEHLFNMLALQKIGKGPTVKTDQSDLFYGLDE